MAQQPVENYGVIGDTHTVALVGKDGSIDFMCFPRFDSPTIFAALLDPENGGTFQLAPESADARQVQLYLPDSAILLTRFLFAEGVAEVSDYMAVRSPRRTLVRRVKTVRGQISFRMLCAPRFHYRPCSSPRRAAVGAGVGVRLRGSSRGAGRSFPHAP